MSEALPVDHYLLRKHFLVPITDDYRQEMLALLGHYHYNLIFQNLKLRRKPKAEYVYWLDLLVPVPVIPGRFTAPSYSIIDFRL